MKLIYGAAVLAAGLYAGLTSAHACACCANTAHRRVEVQKLDATTRGEIDKVRFSADAKLALGEGYEDGIKGLEDPSEDFKVQVTRQKDRMGFAFRDAKGRAGTLSLLQPRDVSIFEVDPRDLPDINAGRPIYKEWKLTAAVAGDGIFRASVGPNRRITLVLHGRGNGCTTAEDFRHWTLLVHGKGTETYTFYGDLQALPPQ
jgi:hypothetical protein